MWIYLYCIYYIMDISILGKAGTYCEDGRYCHHSHFFLHSILTVL